MLWTFICLLYMNFEWNIMHECVVEKWSFHTCNWFSCRLMIYYLGLGLCNSYSLPPTNQNCVMCRIIWIIIFVTVHLSKIYHLSPHSFPLVMMMSSLLRHVYWLLCHQRMRWVRWFSTASSVLTDNTRNLNRVTSTRWLEVCLNLQSSSYRALWGKLI